MRITSQKVKGGLIITDRTSILVPGVKTGGIETIGSRYVNLLHLMCYV